ncbi:unnamed protein product [Effrenium voratum]|nr:unnamed protein product [Effrenium voratum]
MSIQLTKIMGLAKFRESLSEVDQAGADSFAEALEQAAPFFTERQQEQISEWTGLFMSAEPLPPVKAKTETKASGMGWMSSVMPPMQRLLATWPQGFGR